MSFSAFLDSRRAAARALVAQLKKDYAYVSVLGADITARSVRVDRNTSGINPGRDTDCGFVIKLSNGGAFFEYSLDDIAGDPAALAATVSEAFALEQSLLAEAIDGIIPADQENMLKLIDNRLPKINESAARLMREMIHKATF